MLTKAETLGLFKRCILPYLNQADKPLVRREWNDFLNSLIKEGKLSEARTNLWSHPYSH